MSLSTGKKVRSPPWHVWIQHKSDIEQLYIVQKCTLKEVMKAMEAKGFKASEQQYKIKFSEWQISKYKKRGAQDRADRIDSSTSQTDGRGVSNQGPAISQLANPQLAHSQLANPQVPKPQLPHPQLAHPQLPQPQLPQPLLPHPQLPHPQLPHPPLPHPPPLRAPFVDAPIGDIGYVPTLEYFPDDVFSHPHTSEPSNLGVQQGEKAVVSSITGRPGKRVPQPIHEAARSGFLDMVKLLLESDPSCASISDGNGVTAIWIAADKGHLEIVRLLVKCHGVDINATDTEDMRTPLHQAAKGGHVDIVKLLLDANAEPDPPDSDGVTPLWRAAQDGYDEIVQILIEKGANKDIISNVYRRPIHQAAKKGHIEVVKRLLEAGAQVDPHKNSPDDKAPSPLWLAAKEGHVEVAELLIQKGADVDFSSHPSKLFPLHEAARNGCADMVRLLIKNGADVDAREKNGWSPFMIAAEMKHFGVINLLLEHNANVNAEKQDGVTALFVALEKRHMQVIQKLLNEGAKSSATRVHQRRPIHQAAKNGHLEAVRLLLKHYPGDINMEDGEGATPLLLASRGKSADHLEIARYLIEQGAATVLGA